MASIDDLRSSLEPQQSNADRLRESITRGHRAEVPIPDLVQPSDRPGLLETTLLQGAAPYSRAGMGLAQDLQRAAKEPVAAFEEPVAQEAQRAVPGTGPMATRSTFTAAGGAIGTGIGMAAGPPGAIVGSVLGVMGGSAAYDTVNELIRWSRGEEQPAAGFEQLRVTVDQMIEEGAFDAGAMGFMRLAAPALRGVARFITGVPADVANRVKGAARLGLEPTPRDVGIRAKPFVEATSRLPFVGVKRAAERTTQQIDDLLRSTTNRLGPDLTRDEAANALVLGGTKNARRVMDRLAANYAAVETAAKNLGNPRAFSAAPAAKAAQQFLRETGQQAVFVGTGPGISARDITRLRRVGNAEDFLSGLARMEPVQLTYPQQKALRAAVKRLMSAAGPTVPGGPFRDPDAFRALSAVRDGLRQGLEKASVPELAEKAVVANKAWAEWKQFINQPALSEFRAAVPGVATRATFARPRTQEAVDLLDSMARERSPQALESMRLLMGDEAFGGIRRRAFMDTLAKSVAPLEEGGVRLHIPTLRDRLGLTSREGLDRLEAQLAGSDVTVGEIRLLVDGLETVGDQFLPQTSQFMLRNLMLRTAAGGARSGVSGLIAGALLGGAGGAAAAGSVGALIGGTLGTMVPLRLINEALSSRRVLRWMLKAVDASKANRPFEQFIRRAWRAWDQNERQKRQGGDEADEIGQVGQGGTP